LREGDVTGVVVGNMPGTSGLSPLPAAVVMLKGSAVRRSTTSDGRFTLRNLPVGTHALSFAWDADGDGKADRARRLDVPIRINDRVGGGSGRSALDLGQVKLMAPGIILGTVSGPADPSTIVVVIVDFPVPVTVQPDGSYTTDPLGPGRWRVLAGARHRDNPAQLLLSEARDVEVTEDGETRVDLELVPVSGTGRARGTVVEPGDQAAASPGRLFQLLGSGVRFTFYSLVTGFPDVVLEDGLSFDFNLDVGLYAVEIVVPDSDYLVLRLNGFRMGPGDELVLEDLQLSQPRTETGPPCQGMVDMDGDGLCYVAPEDAPECVDVCRTPGRSLNEPCDHGGVPVDCDDDADGQLDVDEVLLPCRCSPNGNLLAGAPTCQGDPGRSDQDQDGICDAWDSFPTCRYNVDPCEVCGDGTTNGLEECDDGNTVDDASCLADCTEVPRLDPAWPEEFAAGEDVNVVVTARRPDNREYSELAGRVVVTCDDPLVTACGGSAPLVSGVAAINVELHTLGSSSVRVFLEALPDLVTVTQTVRVVPGPLAEITLEVSPSAQAGVPTSVTITLHDRVGNPATNHRGVVTLHRDGVPIPGASHDFVPPHGATHTFHDVTLTDLGPASLTAEDATGTVVAQQQVNVTAGPPHQVVLVLTGTLVAGSEDLVLTGTIKDEPGNTVTSYAGTITVRVNGQVHATWEADSPSFTVSPSVVLTRSGLNVLDVTASVAAREPLAGRLEVSVAAADASKLEFTGQPGANDLLFTDRDIPFSVKAVDTHGNVATGAVESVSLTLLDRPATWMVGPPVSLVQGEATLVAKVRAPGTGFTVRAAAGSLPVVESRPFSVGWDPAVVTNVQVTGGSGCVEVAYDLSQSGSHPVDLKVAFSRDSLDWQRTRMAAADLPTTGVTAVPTSPVATRRTFRWNTTWDAYRTILQDIKVSVTATHHRTPSVPATTTSFTIDNQVHFGAPVSLRSDGAVHKALPADLDGDGLPDLVLLGVDGSVSVVMQDSPLRFRPLGPLGGAQDVLDVAAGHANQDGIMDLFFLQQANVGVWHGDGLGGFRASATPVDNMAGMTSIRVANVLGDARGDLLAHASTGGFRVAGMSSGGISARATQFGTDPVVALTTARLQPGQHDAVLVATGQDYVRGYQWDSASMAQSGQWGARQLDPTGVGAGDLNQDGKPDIILVTHPDTLATTVKVYMSTDAYSWNSTALDFTGPYLEAREVLVADVDGDGRNEAILWGKNSTTLLLLRPGARGLTPLTGVTLTDFPQSLYVVDMDGDGVTELVVASGERVLVIKAQPPPRCDPILQSAPRHAVAEKPVNYLVTADFTGDGRPDVVSGNFESTILRLMRGTGNGTLQFAWDLDVGVNPGCLATSDVNGDRRPDLLVCHVDGFSVWLGQADGTLRSDAVVATDAPVGQLAVADLDGDLRDDVVALKGTPDMGFGAQPFLQAGGTWVGGTTLPMGYPSVFGLGRVDGDDTWDLVVTHPQGIGIHAGRGDGSFSDTVPTYYFGGHLAAVVADVDGDGHDEVYVQSGEPHLWYLIRLSPEGVLAANSTRGLNADGVTMRTVDEDGDGAQEVLVTYSQGQAPLTQLWAWNTTDQSMASVKPVPSLATDVVDLNGDGLVDVVATSVLSEVRVFLSRGGDASSGYEGDVGLTMSFSAAAVGDTNGDGWLDVVTSPYGGLLVQRAATDGTWSIPVHQTGVPTPLRLRRVDVNRDGLDDFALFSIDSATFAYGSFDSVAANQARYFGVDLDVGDVTLDGVPDIVLVNADRVDLVDPVQSPVRVLDAVLVNPKVTLADMNGDGALDIVVAHGGGTLVSLNRTPTHPGTFSDLTGWSARSVTQVKMADVNGDGITDVAEVAADGSVRVLLGRGQGSMDTEHTVPVPKVHALDVADVDGDGRVDIVATLSSENAVVTVRQVESLSFRPWSGHALPWPGGEVTVRDADNDGRPDVMVLSRQGTGVIRLLQR
jgi:hypothetical protein